jgi:predicted O-methyltransferase YrrM
MWFLTFYAALIHRSRDFLAERGSLALLDSSAENFRVALWLRSLFSVLDFNDFKKLDLPWWTFHAGDQVAEFLTTRSNPTVFEWGSGASTVWLSQRAGQVVSIESDPVWAAQVTAENLPNARIVHVSAPPLDPSALGQSRRMGYRNLDFSAYVDAINHMDQKFDVIVIDGRARETCFAAALPWLRPDGIVVFDNTNRRRYKKALRNVKHQVVITTTRGLTPILLWPSQTSIIRMVSPLKAQESLKPGESFDVL